MNLICDRCRCEIVFGMPMHDLNECIGSLIREREKDKAAMELMKLCIQRGEQVYNEARAQLGQRDLQNGELKAKVTDSYNEVMKLHAEIGGLRRIIEKQMAATCTIMQYQPPMPCGLPLPCAVHDLEPEPDVQKRKCEHKDGFRPDRS